MVLIHKKRIDKYVRYNFNEMSEKEENNMKKMICILLCAVMLLVSCGIYDRDPLNSPESSDTDALDASSAESPSETDPPALSVVEPRKTELIESPRPMRYALGGEYSFYLPNGSLGDTRQDGMSVIVCAVECLPDTYYDFADLNKAEKRLVRMKTLKNLGKFKVSEEFYLMVPVDFMTDFTAYGSFVINDLLQYGYEGFVLYNKTLGCAERFDLALCACTPYDRINAERMIAFDENGNLVDYEIVEEKKEASAPPKVEVIPNTKESKEKVSTKANTKIKANNVSVSKKENTETATKKVEVVNVQKETQAEKQPEIIPDVKPEEKKETYTENIVEVAESKKCSGNEHGMKIGNSGKWFNSKDEAIRTYKAEINKWGDKWTKDEITNEEYYANCPYGYEVWTCPYCNMWTLNYYYE